jgi:hypothetical protein
MTVKNLVFDVDGCVLRFFETFYKYLTGETWDSSKEIPCFLLEDFLDYPVETINAKFEEFFSDEKCMTTIPFYKNAVESINRLAKRHHIFFCTHLKNTQSRTYRTTHLSCLKNEGIFFVSKAQDKKYVVDELRADIILEDRDTTVQALCEEFPNKKILMPLYGFNKHLEGKYDNLVCFNTDNLWLDLEEYIN